MATRQYRRDSSGRFAGAGAPGAKVTEGRAGGFANAAHRARVANSRAGKRHQSALVRKGVRVAAAGAGAAAAAGVTRAVVGRAAPSAGNGKSLQTSNPGKTGSALRGVVRAVGKAGKSLK